MASWNEKPLGSNHTSNNEATTSRSSSSGAGAGEESLGVALIKSIVLSAATYIAVKYIVDSMGLATSPDQRNRDGGKSTLARLERILMRRNQKKAREEENKEDTKWIFPLFRQRGSYDVSSLTLNTYERILAEDVIDPEEIAIRFRDIGGIDSIKSELWDLVVLPLLRPDLFRSASGLVSPPRGILLYGAPGTGKTMLAKAIAKEGHATFLNVRLSSIMDKWFGESNKLIAATFSLAAKLAPSVIFIDELDTFLNQRDGSEGTATSSMKSEFLTLWDGMLTSDPSSDAYRPVMVLGATNRPHDVDSAILRRLPRTFEIGLPDVKSRYQILQLILEKHDLTEGSCRLLPSLAQVTHGYSGSDLKELCRAAAMEPIREITKTVSEATTKGGDVQMASPPPDLKIRPLTPQDFANALKKVKKTGESAKLFGKRESMSSHNSFALDAKEVAKGIQLLQNLVMGASQTSPQQPNESNEDIPNLANGEEDEEEIFAESFEAEVKDSKSFE